MNQKYPKWLLVIPLLLVVILFIPSCGKVLEWINPNQSSERITIINSVSQLSAYNKLTSENISIQSVPNEFAASKFLKITEDSHPNFSLTLVSEISSPVVNGQTLQANAITIKENKAYVSYNLQGENFGGAIDVIDISDPEEPVLRNRVIFNDTDINNITYGNNYLYLSEAANSAEGAIAQIEILQMTNNLISIITNSSKIKLNGYAANCVYFGNSGLYATSGDNAGVYAFSSINFNELDYSELHDARWIDGNNNYLAVAAGTPGTIALFNFTNSKFSLANTYSFTGANIPGAKTTAKIVGDHIFIAAGTGGVQVHQLISGTFVTEIPLPNTNLDDVVTNAVGVNNDLVFISNGGAGVYVAQAQKKISTIRAGEPIILTMVGKLQLAAFASTNHIVYDEEYLIAATGLQGVKIIKVNR